MSRPEIIEMKDFEYSQQGFEDLKVMLKEGKMIRNPFAKYYCERVEVTINQDIENASIPLI